MAKDGTGEAQSEQGMATCCSKQTLIERSVVIIIFLVW